MNDKLMPLATTRGLLARMLETPDLPARVRALPPASFSALVRDIGVEDSGELVALASNEQLIEAFDEHLFINDAPGERETFDRARFTTWLEVLSEAGEGKLAARFAELPEDFVVHALSSVLLVLETEALRDSMRADDRGASAVEKAIERSPSEEIDGYLLVAREHEGWQATLDLILALDRDHRELLERLLDRCAALASPLLDDLDELATQLSESESLAEDVEAEREARRAARGYVEPRAARSFLTLARQPLTGATRDAERDPVTRAYFRELDRSAVADGSTAPFAAPSGARALPALPSGDGDRARPEALLEALRLLEARDAAVFAERLEELIYLANVLVAAGSAGGERLRPVDAIESVMRSVGEGARLETGVQRPTPRRLAEVLLACSADRLFRRAHSASGAKPASASRRR